MTRVLAICVNYNDEENTCRFVNEFLDQNDSRLLEIIIADTSDRTEPHKALLSLQQIDGRVTLLSIGKNLGYLGAANWALIKYLEKKKLPEWIVISNVDIVFSGNDFLTNLLSIPHYNIAVIAPSIISTKTGFDQNPHMPIKPLKMKVYIRELLLLNYYVYKIFLRLHLLIQDIKKSINLCKLKNVQRTNESRIIYAMHGSFFILSSEYFIRGGNLKYAPFLFGEEYFIAENARMMNLEILYEPKLLLFHDEHKSTGVSLNKQKWEYLLQANTFCLENFF